MKTGKISIFLITIMVAILAVSACTPSRISVDEYNAGQPAAPTSEPQPVEDTSPDAGEEQDPEPEAEPVEPEEESRGDDVPIMDTATNVQASVSGTNITYQVEGTIEDVVTFYQEELPGYGWEMAGPPDNAVGFIATMLRENSAGDRLAINMQFNELGGFVILTITVSRAG
jgi:hypothetical protein